MGKKKLQALPDSRSSHEVLNGREGLIAWFDDFGGDQPWRSLSNFHQGEPIVTDVRYELVIGKRACEALGVDPDGLVTAATGEHLYAAFKASDSVDFLAILESDGPGSAKSLGRSIVMRGDWEEIKYDVMAMVLRLKFTLDRPEGQVLLDTGDALLIEGTYWGDKVWGVDLVHHESDPLLMRGRNWLGTLLMARRAELRAEQLYGHSPMTVYGNEAFSL